MYLISYQLSLPPVFEVNTIFFSFSSHSLLYCELFEYTVEYTVSRVFVRSLAPSPRTPRYGPEGAIDQAHTQRPEGLNGPEEVENIIPQGSTACRAGTCGAFDTIC